MRFTLLLMFILLIVGCTSAEQKASEEYIRETIEKDWEDGVPLDAIYLASKICNLHEDYQGCIVVKEQLTDISLTYKSCLRDSRSKLCQVLVDAIRKHEIMNALYDVDSLTLPSNPFYMRLPTQALEEQASNFGYRTESLTWWWTEWRLLIFIIFVLVIAVFSSYDLWVFYQRVQLEKQEDNKAKIALQIEQKKRLDDEIEIARRAEAARLDAKKEAEIAKQKLIEEQIRVAQEVRLANAKAEKLAIEKAEADALLNAVFNRKK